MSLAEITRWIDRHDANHRSMVSKEVYERDMSELRSDISEIKESQRWAQRLTITILIGLIVQIILQVAV